MYTGKVHLYDSINGIGLLIASDSGEELPFRRKDIVMDLGGPHVLNAGQAVEFEIREGQDGRQATNIQVAKGNAQIDEGQIDQESDGPSLGSASA